MPNDTTLENLLTAFVLDRQRARVKLSTRSYYKFAIGQFIASPGVPPLADDLRPAHILGWLDAMTERGLKPGGQRTYQSAIWVWLRWCYRQDYLPDLTRKISKVRVLPEDVKRLTASTEVHDRFVDEAKTGSEHPERNVAILETLWGSAMRRSELAAVQLGDVDLDALTIFLGKTKMGDPRLVALTPDAGTAIQRYILKARGHAPGPLFLSRGGEGMSSNAIAALFRALSAITGLNYTPHTFRRAAATRMLESGMPLDAVMHQGGWRSAAMALQYGKQGRAKRSIDAFHAAEGRRMP